MKINEASFLTALSVSREYLDKLIQKKLYNNITLLIKNKKPREISIPIQELKIIQRKIKKILENLYKSNDCSHGYVKKRSNITNAQKHLGCGAILCIDIKDFFGTTTITLINRYLKLYFDKKVIYYIIKLSTINGVLPQGSCLSPILSNIVNYKLDYRAFKYFSAIGANYTRYSDDISVSFLEYNKYKLKRSLNFLKYLLECNGYKINLKKTRIMKSNEKKMVTGLMVGDRLGLPKKIRKKFRAFVYNLNKKTEKRLDFKNLDIKGNKCIFGFLSYFLNFCNYNNLMYFSSLSGFRIDKAIHPIQCEITNDFYYYKKIKSCRVTGLYVHFTFLDENGALFCIKNALNKVFSLKMFDDIGILYESLWFHYYKIAKLSQFSQYKVSVDIFYPIGCGFFAACGRLFQFKKDICFDYFPKISYMIVIYKIINKDIKTIKVLISNQASLDTFVLCN